MRLHAFRGPTFRRLCARRARIRRRCAARSKVRAFSQLACFIARRVTGLARSPPSRSASALASPDGKDATIDDHRPRHRAPRGCRWRRWRARVSAPRSAATGSPSESDGMTRASAPARTRCYLAAASQPVSPTLSPSPWRAMLSSTAARCGPSPINGGPPRLGAELRERFGEKPGCFCSLNRPTKTKMRRLADVRHLTPDTLVPEVDAIEDSHRPFGRRRARRVPGQRS